MRLYVCPITGTGSEDDPYRPVCSGLVSKWSKCGDSEGGVVVQCAPTDTEHDAMLAAGCVEVVQ